MASRPTSGMAVASMVLGIVGVLGGWCTFAIPCILAIVFGYVGLGQTRGGARGGRGMAISGLVLGLVPVAVLALMLVFGGIGLLLAPISAVSSKVSHDKSTTAAAKVATTSCTWTPAGGSQVKDIGVPPVTVPDSGTAVLTINTNLGPIRATVDLAKVPCTAASFRYLAGKKFWDGTKCHRLVKQANFDVLQCGDPFATGPGYRDTDGQGGPGYTMAEENLPTDSSNPYPAGSIAMANTGEPSSTGSQFFICAADTQLPASYTLLGTIDSGLPIVQDVVNAGDDGAFSSSAGGGHPNKEVDILTMTFG